MCASSFLRHGGSLGKRGRGSVRRPCKLASPFFEKDYKLAPRCMLRWKPVLLGHSFKQETAFKKTNRPFFRPVYLLSLQCALEDGGQEFFLCLQFCRTHRYKPHRAPEPDDKGGGSPKSRSCKN